MFINTKDNPYIALDIVDKFLPDESKVIQLAASENINKLIEKYNAEAVIAALKLLNDNINDSQFIANTILNDMEGVVELSHTYQAYALQEGIEVLIDTKQYTADDIKTALTDSNSTERLMLRKSIHEISAKTAIDTASITPDISRGNAK